MSAKWSVIGLALAAVFLIGPAVGSAQNKDSSKVTDLFKDVKMHATEAEYDAELLSSYTRSTVSWKSHSDRLSQMKNHANDLLRDFSEAARLRDEASPWQQEAIDRLEPLLQGMASHLTTTINHFNEGSSNIKMLPYIEYVEANQKYAAKTSALIHNVVDYGEAKARAEELDKQLVLTDKAGGV